MRREYDDEEPMRDRAPITAGMEELELAIIRLQELSERLEHRLEPVLGPERPHPTDGSARAVERTEQSSMAEWFEMMAARVRATAYRTERVLSRIELG